MCRGEQTSRMSTCSHPRPVSVLCRVAPMPPALTESLLKTEMRTDCRAPPPGFPPCSLTGSCVVLGKLPELSAE